MSIESAIYTWLVNTTGLPVWQQPVDSGVDLSGDYITFQVVNIVAGDFNIETDGNITPTDFTRTVTNRAELFLSVNCYVGRQSANEPRNILTRLQHSSSFWQSRYDLSQDGLAINRHGNIQDLTGLGETNFVRRGQLDIEFLADISTEWQWDRLLQWQLTGIMSDENDVVVGSLNYP